MYSELYDYAYYDSIQKSPHHRRCIDGHVTGCGKCVGYCTYEEHSGFLTERLCKEHNCIEKGCYYFLPKPEVKRQRNSNKPGQDLDILESAIAALKDREGIRPMKVKSEGEAYVVQFVTITNLLGLEAIAKKLSQSYGVSIRFERLMYDFDKCVSLIMAS